MSEPHRVTRRRALASLGLAAGSAVAAPAVRAQAPVPAGPAADASGPFSIPQYEERARGLMSVPAWEYYDQGCADDITVRWNREALQRLRLESRVMVDVE